MYQDFEFGSCKSVHFAPSNYAVNFMGSIIKQTQDRFQGNNRTKAKTDQAEEILKSLFHLCA